MFAPSVRDESYTREPGQHHRPCGRLRYGRNLADNDSRCFPRREVADGASEAKFGKTGGIPIYESPVHPFPPQIVSGHYVRDLER